MAKKRSPSRDRAYELWQSSNGKMQLKEIANQLSIPVGTIRAWKKRDDWDVALQKPNCNATQDNCNAAHNDRAPDGKFLPGNQISAGFGAPQGNNNGLGNNGGAPPGNKNALKTGQYETIWLNCLSEEEQALFEQIDTDEMVQTEETIRSLVLQERRMLIRLREKMEGVTEKERKIISECRNKGEILQVFDKDSGISKMVYQDKPEMIVIAITETEFRKIDDVLKIEKALLDVQGRKGRQLELKHKLQMEQDKLQLERKRVEIMSLRAGDFGDKDDNGEAMQSFIDALTGKVGGTWDE